jgi:F-type H+-transporting ATPase subunit b
MDQIIEAFGIDWKLITIQLVNFAILLGALSYFLYRPVLKLLDERAATIEQGVADAEAAATAKASAEREKQATLTAAQQEAAAIAERARAHAHGVEEAATRDAATKATAIIADAEVRAQEAKRKAEKESEAEITKLAVLAAERLLRERA